MAAYIFQSIAKKGKAAGVTPNLSASARNWYRDEASKLASKNVNKNRMMNDKQNVVGSISATDIGKMFMFFYDPIGCPNIQPRRCVFRVGNTRVTSSHTPEQVC